MEFLERVIIFHRNLYGMTSGTENIPPLVSVSRGLSQNVDKLDGRI